MIHYSCDRCKRQLDADELRYVVRLEVQAAMDPVDQDECEDDRDHLLEIQEILERLDDEESDLIGEEVYHRRRYDLCCDCRRRFVEDPLGAASSKAMQLPFSPN